MTSTNQGSARVSDGADPLAPAALDNLAHRFRPSGLCLLAVRPNGTIHYFDSAAAPFFQESLSAATQELREHASAITVSSNIVLWKFLPGVVLAAIPHVERRQVRVIFVLAAKSESSGESRDIPAYGDDALIGQARLLQSMVRDQVRLGGLEAELDSMSAQLSNTYEELSLLYQLSSGMRINRSASDFFKQACLDVMELISVRGMGVALRNDSGTPTEPVLYGSMSLPPGKVHRLADDLMQLLRQRKAPLLINQLKSDKSFNWLSEHARQLLAVPLLRGEQLLGCLFGLDKQSGEFDTVDSKLLNSIANESAIYLENSMLYEDVRGLLMGLLHSLVSAVDAKDAYTCGHSERVALLSRVLAQEANLGDTFVERVYMAGLLHDVGKIGVPEAVLQKTGKLTPEEYEQIKKHPEIGARILGDIRQIQDVIPGVLHHHERYDGKGYPMGLAGDSIPMMGRLICLADCFDAMTSSRTYRKALPLEVAMTELKRCAGTQFDPELTDAFLKVGADRFRELLTDHKRQTKHLIEMQQSLRAA